MPQKQNMMIHITQQKNKTKILSEQDEPLFAMSLPLPGALSPYKIIIL